MDHGLRSSHLTKLRIVPEAKGRTALHKFKYEGSNRSWEYPLTDGYLRRPDIQTYRDLSVDIWEQILIESSGKAQMAICEMYNLKPSSRLLAVSSPVVAAYRPYVRPK